MDEDGLRGITSNPSIFEKAISGSTDYADLLNSLKSRTDLDAKARYEILAIRDIQDAADILRPVYESTKRRDGYVSLEVSPYLARDTQGTIQEARALWKSVARENVMIKVPGTPEGIPAFQQLISEGININVTLLCSQKVYEEVAEAYIAGLEQLAAKGGDISRMASVASFFISRIDNSVDAQLAAKLKTTNDEREQAKVRSLLGKVAIANGKLTYQRHLKIFGTDRWKKRVAKGAQTQRVLWASTSTKNPSYSDVMYVEEMIGPDTVNTVPPATLDAFRDHGHARQSLTEDIEGARQVMAALASVGISIDEITAKLTEDGVRLFGEAFDKLLEAVEKSGKSETSPQVNRQSYKLPEELAAAVKTNLDDWRGAGKVRRLWQRDASLWTGADESNWLGWLGITEDEITHSSDLQRVAEDVKKEGFSDILLLGMGGSSLAPEVLAMTFGKIDGFPRLHVLDSTDPVQIRASEDKLDLAETLFIVSSKSGSTLEPNIFKQYFFERVKQTLGAEKAGSRFIAITDPGSKLDQVATADRFRQVFHGLPSIGGRYSALSNFGMVPAALMGLDTIKFLDLTEEVGHPVVRISVADTYDLGQEFFRWEIATAVAGSIIGINAFNQPDVEASKVATRNLTAEYEKRGSLPEEKPFFEEGGIKLFTDDKNSDALAKASGSEKSLAGYLRAHLNRLTSSDYFALLAYIQMNSDHISRLQELRHLLRDKRHNATCVGFGPRFLHSTGQAYKGGPNSGVFVQITCDDAADLPVPGQKYTFGVVKAAQARGDFRVLAERGRRALRVHLGKDLQAGLVVLQAAFRKALS